MDERESEREGVGVSDSESVRERACVCVCVYLALAVDAPHGADREEGEDDLERLKRLTSGKPGC